MWGTDPVIFDYTYDKVGNRLTADGTSTLMPVDNVTYIYDQLHRLKAASYATGFESFNLDMQSNRTVYFDARVPKITPYGANNDANEYSTIDSATLTYDDNGNLHINEKSYRFTYDFENRLTKIEIQGSGPGMGPVGGGWQTVATFAYDALGRRIESTESFGFGYTAELYYYDGRRVLAEYDESLPGSGTGTLARYFVDGPTYIDEHLLMHDEAADEDHYYLLRELYSVTGLSDETGALVESCVYDAYGKAQMYDATQSPIAFSSVGNRYAFTARRPERFVTG